MPPQEREREEVLAQIEELVRTMKGVEGAVREEMQEVLRRRRWEVFSNRLGGVKQHEFRIRTGNSAPVRRRGYRMFSWRSSG